MKLLKKLLIPLLLLTVLFTVASCKDEEKAVNIVSVKVESYELVFGMSDGSSVRAGKLPENAENIRLVGAVIEDGELILTYTDGISKNCGALPEFTEDRVLRAATITSDGMLILHTSTGKVDLGKLLYLSAPEEELTPSGASEYAESRNTEGRDTATVEIKVKGYGTITLLLDATTAPTTVENFLALARSGFYDGLTFHRVMEGFMIQGGDPKADGTGNSSKTIYGEFSANGYAKNDLSHKRGVISMARATPNDSASCQFFICNADASRSLDGSYAAFGYVINGMNIVDAITEYTVPFSNAESGTIANKAKQAVIEKVTVVDDLDITTVQSAQVDESGALTLTLSNGTVLNSVSVPANPENLAFTKVSVSGSRLALSISDGYRVTTGLFPIISGDTSGAVLSLSEDYHLIITADGKDYDLGKVIYPTVPGEELSPEGASEYADSRDTEGRNYAIVEVKFRGYGTVTILLDATAAPKTVANFLSLVNSGYYNGLDIHAVIYGAMMESGNGGGELDTVVGEFSSNGYEGNDLSHKRGVISMIHYEDPNSATSMFFICADDLSEDFDGKFAAFGYVINGMNIVDEIIELTAPYSDPNSGYISDEDKRAVIESVTVTRDLDDSVDVPGEDNTDTPGEGSGKEGSDFDDGGWSQM